MKEQEELPLVSLVITCYNRQELVGRAIESALKQDYKNLEIIVADNDSTDSSADVIRKYLGDSRVRFHQNEINIGMLPNFKDATENYAKGLLVTYLSSDDYLGSPGFISEAVAAFQTYGTLVAFSAISKSRYLTSTEEIHNMAYSYKASHDLLNKLLKGKFIFSEFAKMHLLNFGGSVFYRSDIIELDVFRENNTTFADLQAILLLALKGDFYLSGNTGYVQTFHSENASQVRTDAAKALLNLNFAEIPYTAAKSKNVFSDHELDAWLHQILKPTVFSVMTALYTNNRSEYHKYITAIKANYPAVFSELNARWKFIKYAYSNPLLYFFYKKYQQARYGK